MSEWTTGDLAQIAGSDDLHVAPYRTDGRTSGTPTWIWAVVLDGGLYVRAYNGQQSSWHRAALQQGEGQIKAAGMTRDVHFQGMDGDAPEQNAIDDAYRARYRGSPYLAHMVGATSRGATVRITPRP